jgi:hypothetical protein
MCPVCIASAALIAGSVTTAGGLTAFVANIFRRKKSMKANTSNNAIKPQKEK